MDKLLRSVCGRKARRDKGVLEGNVYELLAYNWSLAAVSLDAPRTPQRKTKHAIIKFAN